MNVKSLVWPNSIGEFSLEETLKCHLDQPPTEILVLENKKTQDIETVNRRNILSITHSFQAPVL